MIVKNISLDAGTVVRSPSLVRELVGGAQTFSVEQVTLSKPMTVQATWLPRPLLLQGSLDNLSGVAELNAYHPDDLKLPGYERYALGSAAIQWIAKDVLLTYKVTAKSGDTVQSLLENLTSVLMAQFLEPGAPLEGGRFKRG